MKDVESISMLEIACHAVWFEERHRSTTCPGTTALHIPLASAWD
jgi:hypothetical protein